MKIDYKEWELDGYTISDEERLTDAILARVEHIKKLEAELERLRDELRNMVSLAVPGMAWQDEIGRTVLSDARKALEAYDG